MRRKDREITDKTQIKEILNKSDACRIAFAVNNTPYIVTMNFGYEWNDELTLYFHCAHEGMKLDMMQQNNQVCFQTDIEHELNYNEATNYCTMNYSSIVGWGALEIISNDDERKKALDLLMTHHGHAAPKEYPAASLSRTTILRLKVSKLTAKAK